MGPGLRMTSVMAWCSTGSGMSAGGPAESGPLSHLRTLALSHRPDRTRSAPNASPMLLVQKYGGTSVGTPERIKAVARRVADARRRGHSLVVVVSAMGDTTDDLTTLASLVTGHARPQDEHPREMDMLLTAGERIAAALLTMA